MRAFTYPDETEGFTTDPTPDLLVAVNTGGPFTIESKRPGGWNKARPRPGSIGTTAPGSSSTLRWRRESSEQLSSFHMYLSAGLLQETAEGLGNPGLLSRVPAVLQLEDPVVAAIGHSLLRAVEQRADALYADSLAQSLALHMVYGRLLGSGPPRSSSVLGALNAAALGRVLEYMHANLADRVVLEDLSRVASISKFHFVRQFRLATGDSPHRYLTRLRMQRASELLRNSEDTVQQISAACGYASPGQFATTFRRHYGANPTQYRRTRRPLPPRGPAVAKLENGRTQPYQASSDAPQGFGQRPRPPQPTPAQSIPDRQSHQETDQLQRAASATAIAALGG